MMNSPNPAYEGAYLADLNEINGEAPAASRRMVVVSSDLFRAQQTAHAIADLLGLDVALDPRLRERSFGEWEGMTREEILEQYADDYHSWRAHTGGETKRPWRRKPQAYRPAWLPSHTKHHRRTCR